MIQLAEDIEYGESKKVPLDSTLRKLFIEVASNKKIDIAVVDEEQLQAFDKDDEGDEEAIEWEEQNTRSSDFEYVFPKDKKKRYLLFWSPNERGDAIIAYKITPIK